MFHIDNNGNAKPCRAKQGKCPFVLHGETSDAVQKKYEIEMQQQSVSVIRKTSTPASETISEFSNESFYGNLPPRSIQIPALNDVAHELEDEDSTQLIAACGTGKTFMHRQLLNHFMGKEDSNGIGIMLTSSIRLAQDTASDLRPDGGYDQSLGTFGEDYEVVEVHADAKGYDGRQSVVKNGAINVDRIHEQIDNALKNDKKVIIVSTYDSVRRIRAALDQFEDGESHEADLLIHDEAHNILGQQTPTTLAQGEENNSYVGFHNDIPGSLQAKKRLYSTATPIVRETEGDKQSSETLDGAKIEAQAVAEGKNTARVTFYSDDAMIGNVSGFIPQHTAIEHQCLATPSYEIRENGIVGNIKDFNDPVVDIHGKLKERSESPSRTDLNVSTYGAVQSTLKALVSDSSDEKNAANNVLAYVGSINQTQGFKHAFKEIALSESGGMSLADAEKNMNSDDEDLRKRARMRLVAEHSEVLAAHSGDKKEVKDERARAFKMFKGNEIKSTEWSPHKRVLANVNIFSEGVSIPEIDTVVISDDDKFNERAMTQAIGRSIRVVPNNDVKKYGHVIIPSVIDSTGENLSQSSVNLAAYTATRVERGSTAAKIRGDQVQPDGVTNFTVYKKDGSKSTRLARDYAQNSVTELKDLAVAAEMETNHTYLMSKDEGYKNLTRSEQFEVAKSRIHEKIAKLKKDSPTKSYLLSVRDHIDGKSQRDIRNISRNGKVVSAALATGDIGSLNSNLASKLLEKGILSTKSSASDVSTDEKRKFIESHAREVAFTLLTTPPGGGDSHKSLQDAFTSGSNKNENTEARKKIMSSLRSSSKSSGAETEKAMGKLQSLLKDEKFVESAHSYFATATPDKMPILGWGGEVAANLKSSQHDVAKKRFELKRQAAESGEHAYSVDTKMVRKTGELNSAGLRKLLGD